VDRKARRDEKKQKKGEEKKDNDEEMDDEDDMISSDSELEQELAEDAAAKDPEKLDETVFTQ